MEKCSSEPCLYSIGADVGSAFSVGVIGRSIFQSVSGFCNAPKGQKLKTMFQEVRMKAPLTGVQLAAFSCLFSSIDCCMVAVRKKKDSFNPIVSGSFSTALLALRSGPKMMGLGAFLGGTFFAIVEGVDVFSSRCTDTDNSPTLKEPENLLLNDFYIKNRRLL